MALENWELASYVVTVFGLPFAVLIFFFEQRKERDNEEEEGYQMLSDAYNDFLKVVLDNPDLRLRSAMRVADLTPDQRERMQIIFEMLVALFERAYLVAYEPGMQGEKARRWNSWEDYMREWCRREDFRRLLPTLLQGEDPDFAAYIAGLAEAEGRNRQIA
jgi:hypothetical protein